MAVTRRSVLIAGAAAGAAAGPLAAGVAGAPARAAEPASATTGAVPAQDAPATAIPRRSVPLDTWRFALVNPAAATDPTGAYAHAAEPAFDDSGWRPVAVPHDWSIELTPTTEDGTASGTGFFPGGLGWYRTSFTLPAELAGARVSVEFDGVYMDSTVYCNGTEVGGHPYGYTGFAFDITDLVHTDGRTADLLAVQVRNQLPSSRWYSGSGIYRNARLVVTSPVHVARWGTYVTTPGLEADYADGHGTVRVTTSVIDETGGGASSDVTVVSTVLDPEGRQVTRTSGVLPGVGADAASITQELRVDHPRLWDLDDPTRYTLSTELRVAGRTVDTYSTRFGFRWLTVSPDTGLSVNGRRHKLQGVDLHHDQGALGAAINRDAVLRQMTVMKSMGVNSFRTSHNPPSPEMLDVCEELGILMMVEAFDCWHTGKNTYDYHRFFDQWSDADISEMVLAARNSPAVLMWSIGNEIPDSTSEVGVPIAERLIADIRALDTSRPVVIGSDKYRSVPAAGSPADRIALMLDGLGVNYNTAASLDALHARYPHLFLFASESSSETSTRGAYQEPDHLNTGENYTPGRRATSSFDNNLASWTISGEYSLKSDRDRPFFAGQFFWSGTDYIGEPTPYDVFPVKTSFFGAVDTAGFPKDFYHLFRSQWSDQPMVHLLPMDWTTHSAGETVEVWAYANAPRVELFLNGTSLGAKEFDTKSTVDGRAYLETTEATHDDRTVTSGPYPGSYTSPNGSAGKLHLTWQVPFAPGELRAVASRDGRTVAIDVLRTAGPAHAVRLTPDRAVADADGDSLIYLTADVVDAAGTVVPDAEHLITFEVRGAGSLAGVDNGRQESAERYQASTRTAFHGKALAIVRTAARPGAITVTAAADGLAAGRAELRAANAGPHTALPEPVLRPGPAAPAPAYPAADASFSGRPDTLPAAMLDGDPATGWSNAFDKAATALLPEFKGARPADWVRVDLGRRGPLSRIAVSFTVDATHSLPASLTLTVLDGGREQRVGAPDIAWASASDAPTVITFAPVPGDAVRLDLVSAHPGAADGHIRISALEVTAD